MSESTGTPRRPFRFLYQFSLRSLLLVTAAVAVFCNWYFQPKYHEEELAGKDLRVRRQMKLLMPKETGQNAVIPMVPGVISTGPQQPVEVNHGHYTLLDRDDFVLTRGQFAEGEESGNWVNYYPTGNKAAEGKMLHGVKVGLWRTWYEDGTLASEVNYRREPVAQEQLYRDYFDWAGPGGGSGVYPKKVVDPHVDCLSSREGSAKAWHPTGQLKFEGAYKDNQQHGDWSFYDAQGRLTAKGPFRRGKRHGEWTVIQSRRTSEGNGSDAKLVRRYIDGRSVEQLARLTTRLEKQLESPQAYRRQQALIDLAEVGEPAVPILLRRLSTADKAEQAALLAVLPRMKDAAAPLLPKIRELVTTSDATIAHHARLSLYQLDATSRAALYDGLVAEAVSDPSVTRCLGDLVALYRCDPARQAAVFAELMSLPPKREDVEDERLNAAVMELGGNVGPHILAAISVPNSPVRLRGAKMLLAVFRGWPAGRTYVTFDKKEWETLLETLKNDPSLEIRALVEEIEQGPQFYGGVGGFNGNLGGVSAFSGGGGFF